MKKFLAVCVFLLGALLLYSEVYAQKYVSVGGKKYSINTYREDYVKELSNNQIFDDIGLNSYVVYEVDYSPVESRSWLRRVYDSVVQTNYNLGYKLIYDKEGMRAYLEEYNLHADKPQNAYLEKRDGVGLVVAEVPGTMVGINAFLNALGGNSIPQLSDYYIKPDIVAADKESALLKLNKYLNWEVTYSNGLKVKADPAYINISESDSIEVDDSFLDASIKGIVDGYYTVGVSRSFLTHTGEEVTVTGGTWGSEVDTDRELKFLKEAFNSGKSYANRSPFFKKEQEDVGSDYIEISISEQHVWHYVNGVLCCDSECVTGVCDGVHETPTGIYYLLEKQNGRMLRPKGASSGSWVNKWMRITWDGVGLHDASWRSSFGGTIYRNNGSHGCINLPKKYAYVLYDEVYTGIPVVVY